jgi:hypothetical protein
MPLRTEEAYDFLVAHLATIPANIGRPDLVRTRYAHIYLPDLVPRFWQGRGSTISFSDLTDEHFRPFYDALWELARIGVTRPGRVAPKGQETANDNFGDHWSITEFGFQWLADASKRSYVDMSRLSEIFAIFHWAVRPWLRPKSRRSRPNVPHRKLSFRMRHGRGCRRVHSSGCRYRQEGQ